MTYLFIMWVYFQSCQRHPSVNDVVTANCSIEVLPYSTYDQDNPCTPKTGYVKLNGVSVWRASRCGYTPGRRGVNILLIDPFRCSKQESRRFDTHISSDASAQLGDYLRLMNHGQVIVGVTADEPTRKLSSALSTLRQFGVNVGDVQYRGSFGFVVQKGFPEKTVLRKAVTEAESHANQPHFIATITGRLQHTSLSACDC